MIEANPKVGVPLAIGSVVTGLWCEACSLSSRYEAAVYVLEAEGPRQIGTINRCDGHQE